MDENTLLLYYDNGNRPIFRNCFNASGVRCRSWLKNDLVYRIYIRINKIRSIRKYFADLLYYYPTDMDGLIILFDTKLPDHYINKIRKKNPRAKIIVWFWNEINSENILRKFRSFDVWSYSPADCIRYGLLYNSQFLFDALTERYQDIRDRKENLGEQSFVFMGREKGRSETVLMIADEIRKCGWGCRTDFLSTNRKDRLRSEGIEYSAGFQYTEYIKKMMKYRGILDVVYQNNSGLSLRALESIFFHKKLITNNPLVKLYDFYDENNIFVWGQSEMSLEEFLSRPYRPVPDSICQTYLLSSWLSRFKTYYGIN